MLLSMQENTAPNPLAKEELNLLARLMGGLEIKKPLVKEAGFRLNLFTTDEEEEYDTWLSMVVAMVVGLPYIQSCPWPLKYQRSYSRSELVIKRNFQTFN